MTENRQRFGIFGEPLLWRKCWSLAIKLRQVQNDPMLSPSQAMRAWNRLEDDAFSQVASQKLIRLSRDRLKEVL